jgi:hypothetical protein
MQGTHAVCMDCNGVNVTGNPCRISPTFSVQTQVANNGQNLKHSIFLTSALADSVTSDKLITNLAVKVRSTSRRRLLVVDNPLIIVPPVEISSDRKVIYITTNFVDADASTSSIVVDFQGGVLVSADGTIFTSTTDSFALSSPIYAQSYYNAFKKDITTGAEGMVFILLSLVLLVIQLVIANRKGYHEIMSFIMVLQVVGITRIRQYPINYDVYSVLVGYSYF